MLLHLQLVLVIAVCSCSSYIEKICVKEQKSDMTFNITCKCNDIIKDFQVTEEFSYFEDAKYVTISNCQTAILDSTDVYSTELEHLHLHHIQYTVFNVFLPSSLSSLEIEDVGNLTGLRNHIFLHVQYLHNLVIKNTNVQFIDGHTFSDTFVTNVHFINTTFKYLERSSLNFTGMKDDSQNSILHIERCTFDKLDADTVSVKNMKRLLILESEFKGILKNRSFQITKQTTALLHSNSFTCGKRQGPCDDLNLDIVDNLYQFNQNNAQDMCSLLQMNYCMSTTKSLISSLQNCYPKLLKYGVNESCTPLEPEKGHSFILGASLSLVCTLLLTIML